MLALAALGCGERDGIVGVQPLGSAGSNGSAGAAGTAGTATSSGAFSDEFAETTGAWNELPKLPGGSARAGIGDARARDGRLAELRFPGHPEYDATERAGTAFATELSTVEAFHFGTFRTRVGFGSCDASEDAVMAFLGYFSDGSDRDDDGIVDELVMSMQVLCAAPNRLYLTVFTDYQEQPKLRFRKLSRTIDFATGRFAETPAANEDPYGPEKQSAAFLLPGTFAADALYELGFEWRPESLRFFLQQGGDELELWTLTGAEIIPQEPVHIVYHSWHPPTHWYPLDDSAEYPDRDVVTLIDWVSFEPL